MTTDRKPRRRALAGIFAGLAISTLLLGFASGWWTAERATTGRGQATTYSCPEDQFVVRIIGQDGGNQTLECSAGAQALNPS